MRLSLVLFTIALAGCASQAPAPAPVTHQVKIDNSNVEDVQRAGYKIVNKDGVKLFCRTDPVTGSHVQMHTTCLTEREMQEQNEETRQSMERLGVITQGPKGT
jgi:hypothetical protein